MNDDRSSITNKESIITKMVLIIVIYYSFFQTVQLILSLFLNFVVTTLKITNSSDLIATRIILDSFILIITIFPLIKLILSNNDFIKEIDIKILRISLIQFVFIFLTILGLFIYFSHFLVIFMNRLPFLFRENYFISYFDGISFIGISSLNSQFMIIKYVILITLIEEILFRFFLLRGLIKLQFGLLTSSLLSSTIFIIPSLSLIFILNNFSNFVVIIVIKFSLSFILSIIYYLTRKISFTYVLNVSISGYLLFHQVAYSNPTNYYINYLFDLVKLGLIYFSFTLFIMFIGFRMFKKTKVEIDSDKIKNGYFDYSPSFFSKNLMLIGISILILFPNFLNYYIDNILYIRSDLDVILTTILKITVFSIFMLIIIRKMNILDLQFNKNDLEIKNINEECKTFFHKTKLKFNIDSIYRPRVIFENIFNRMIKIALLILLLLPLIYFNVEGILKVKLFEMFDLEAFVSASYSQHIIYSILDVRNLSGLTFGNNSLLLLKNIGNNYLFLPTSYYTQNIDVLYGIIASITWFISFYFLIKIVMIIKNTKASSLKYKLIIIFSYFLVTILWNIFNFGLFKPSSFLTDIPDNPVTTSDSVQSNLISIENFDNFRFFFLPFGFLLIFSILLLLSFKFVLINLKSLYKKSKK